MNVNPLHHVVRVRRSEDLDFVRGGLMDEVLINANQVENSVESVATALRQTTLPFSIDPMLWRFQVPEWWRNDKGETKRNYKRLGGTYLRGTSIDPQSGPLVDLVNGDDQWRLIARNAVSYQQSRLRDLPTQLELLVTDEPRKLVPARIVAPALVPYTRSHDAINRVLAEESIAASETGSAVQVVVPRSRLEDRQELSNLLRFVPREGVTSYWLWTPEVSEDALLSDAELLSCMINLIATLASRAVPVAHQYGNYSIAALHDLGLSAVAHHLGWVDRGETGVQQGQMIRSCTTYAPALRHTIRFGRAAAIASGMNLDTYREQYCGCAFCIGVFERGQHPLDILLEDTEVSGPRQTSRRTPTGRAVAANTWHYLLTRRSEIQAFSGATASEVIARDIERAAGLSDRIGVDRLKQLASAVKAA